MCVRLVALSQHWPQLQHSLQACSGPAAQGAMLAGRGRQSRAEPDPRAAAAGGRPRLQVADEGLKVVQWRHQPARFGVQHCGSETGSRAGSWGVSLKVGSVVMAHLAEIPIGRVLSGCRVHPFLPPWRFPAAPEMG